MRSVSITEAQRRLPQLEIMRKLPKHRGRRRNISGHVKEYLYGSKA